MSAFEGEKLPEKAVLMYQAVIDMLGEGKSIPSLKVSDITRRAGIGKGTAYEYFESKEELICEAIDWNFRCQLAELNHFVEERRTFREKIYGLLDWMEQQVPKRRTFLEMIGPASGSCCVSADMKSRMGTSGHAELVQKTVNGILETGIREGVIAEAVSEYNRKTAFASQIITYFFWLHWEQTKKGRQTQEVKDQIYENILRLYR